MHTWHWQNWQGLPYLTCSLLDPFPHGFFTRPFCPRSPAELVEVLHPEAAVYRVKQVHGGTVLAPSEIEPTVAAPEDKPPLPEADGLLTNQEGQSVWVCSADCTPVLIGDARTGQVAAVHAGWRGTAASIVSRAIARLQEQGSQLEDLRVVMGPAIAGEVYQVSTTVAAEVGSTLLLDVDPEEPARDPETVLDSLRQFPNSPVLDDPKPGHARLDVRRVSQLQLEQLGLGDEQVAIAPYCTYQQPNYFFSYRRDRLKQVQWSGIVSVEAQA